MSEIDFTDLLRNNFNVGYLFSNLQKKMLGISLKWLYFFAQYSTWMLHMTKIYRHDL